MLKFSIDTKEFKNAIDKLSYIIPKKSNTSILLNVELSVNENKLLLHGTDFKEHLVINAPCDEINNAGNVLVNFKDLQLVCKLTGIIIFEEQDNSIKITNHKKIIKIKKIMDINKYPKFPNDEKNLLLTITNNKLFTIFDKEFRYTDCNNFLNNEILKCFNFNIKDNRVEACEGHSLCTIKLNAQNIKTTKNFMLLNTCVHNLKKCVKKIKIDKNIDILKSANRLFIKSDDFEYTQLLVNGEYYNINSMINYEATYSVNINTQNMKEISKYNIDIIKSNSLDRKPLILFNKNGKLYSYFNDGIHKIVDEIETTNNDIENNFLIGFNPQYIYDAYDVIDVDCPKTTFIKAIAPMSIFGDEVRVLILPIKTNITKDEVLEAIK